MQEVQATLLAPEAPPGFRVTIAIDPGVTGAIVKFVDGVPLEIADMPVIENKQGKNEPNAYEIADILRGMIAAHPGADFKVVLEQVNAFTRKSSGPDQRDRGMVSTAKFFQGIGRIEGVVACLKLPLVMVSPMRWKNHHRLAGASKDAGRQLAIQKWPHLADQLRLVKHHNRADAALMGDSVCSTEWRAGAPAPF